MNQSISLYSNKHFDSLLSKIFFISDKKHKSGIRTKGKEYKCCYPNCTHVYNRQCRLDIHYRTHVHNLL